MRYLYLGLLLLALLMLLCCLSAQAVTARTDAVLLPLGRALEAGAPEDAEARSVYLVDASDAWRDGLGLLSCLLSHSYTREISAALEELPLLSGAEFERSCRGLLGKLRTIAEMDLPRIGNIF